MPKAQLELSVHPDLDRVMRATNGDAQAMEALVESLLPVIRARAVRTLLARRDVLRGRDVRQEAEDLTQEVWLALFTERGRTLRAWDPARGLTLEGFVALVAERQIASIMRSGRRSPWIEDPVPPEELPPETDPTVSAEVRLESRDMCLRILDRLRETLSVKGLQLFNLLFIEEKPIEAICEETGLERGAVYTWKSRILRTVRRIAHEIEGGSES